MTRRRLRARDRGFMEILSELAKRAVVYVCIAEKSTDATRRDQYLALAAEYLRIAARRAQALIGTDVVADETWESITQKSA